MSKIEFKFIAITNHTMSASIFELAIPVYYAPDPSKYILVTGAGITDIKVMKSGWKHMFQNATIVDISPHNYEFSLHALSSETLPFMLPVVFTVGTDIHEESDIVYGDAEPTQVNVELTEDGQPTASLGALLNKPQGKRLTGPQIAARNKDNIRRFARFLAKDPKNRDSIIKGIVEGEARVLTARMTIEQIFNDRMTFKEVVINRINEELRQFGMRVMNANIKDLHDAEGSEYFLNRRKKILADAHNQAIIDVAKADYNGKTKATETNTSRENKVAELTTQSQSLIATQEALLRQKRVFSKLDHSERAEANAAAAIAENDSTMTVLKSSTALDIERAMQAQSLKAAQIKQEFENELAKIQLQERNQQAAAKAELERKRAVEVTEATVKAEALIKKTQADQQKVQIDADAAAYQAERIAKAKQAAAVAEAEAIKILAAANLDKQLKEAQATLAQRNAEAEGIKARVAAYGNPMMAVLEQMVTDGQFVKIAQSSADAFKGLNPNISYWGIGDKSADGGNVMNPLTSIMASLPPMLATIEKQTGMPFVSTLMNSFKPNTTEQSQ